ncbi:hypothetical protein R1sor_004268 [Riccia sorocarpa]|uniref:4Fe-4S ferredoxin-type domain-containing protein n=1 Tax=Riccia sorocarpa TaxID=122646 RepID=A0ABD3H801_9MARC
MMDSDQTSVRLPCASSGQCEILQPDSGSASVDVREIFLAIRFSLGPGSILVSRSVKTESGEDAILSINPQTSSTGSYWTLLKGSTNIVYGNRVCRNVDAPSEHDSGGVQEDNSSVDVRPSEARPITPVTSENLISPYVGWRGVQQDPFLLSAFDAVMSVSRANELGKLDLASFTFERVPELPRTYNGNFIFELPPVSAEEATKRNGFRAGMDRRQDCYLWTRLITTEAGHGRKKMYEISQISCVGFLKCANLACPYKARHGTPNVTDWPTGVHRSKKYSPGDFVPNDGHKCLHCTCRALCVEACPAKMFFVLPSKGKKTSPSSEQGSHMSRCVVHVGMHCHPSRTAAPRHLVDLVQVTVKEEFNKSPRSSPSVLRKKATASVIDKVVNTELTPDMTEEERTTLFQGIASVANPDKVLNMIKSIKRSNPPLGELSEIASMQQNTMYRTLQRSLFPGQADKDSRCFVLKMGAKGKGSGVDTVNRMRPGGDLGEARVMWDVMWRIDSKWCTMGIHVYNHVVRCLTTIAICELKAEDQESMEIPWIQLNNVMVENGHQPAEFYGFMSDNAEAGWIAVRKVFWNGLQKPERDRGMVERGKRYNIESKGDAWLVVLVGFKSSTMGEFYARGMSGPYSCSCISKTAVLAVIQN